MENSLYLKLVWVNKENDQEEILEDPEIDQNQPDLRRQEDLLLKRDFFYFKLSNKFQELSEELQKECENQTKIKRRCAKEIII